MTSQEIKNMQFQLYMQGYKGKDGKALTLDGQMGPNTAYAAQRMLRDNGYNITVDGIWGSQSQAAYNSYSQKHYDSSLNKEKTIPTAQNYQVTKKTTANQTNTATKASANQIKTTQAQPTTNSGVRIYDSSLGKDVSPTVAQYNNTSNKQGTVYDSSLGKDWSDTVNQNYSVKKSNSGNKKENDYKAPTNNRQLNYIQQKILQDIEELERRMDEQSKANTPQVSDKKDSQPLNNGKQDYISQRIDEDLADMEKSLSSKDSNADRSFSQERLKMIIGTDKALKAAFADQDVIRRTQEMLNSFGFGGPNGEELREDGVLDANTLYAWYLMRSSSDPFYSFSQQMNEFVRDMTDIRWRKSSESTVEDDTITELFNYISRFDDTGSKKRDFSSTELLAVTNSDPRLQAAFADKDMILRTQKMLNARGFTDPNGQKLIENGVLNANTLYAWYLMRSSEDPFYSFSDQMADLVSVLTLNGESANMDLPEGLMKTLSPDNIVQQGEDFWLGPIRLEKEVSELEGIAAVGQIFDLAIDAGVSAYNTYLLMQTAVALENTGVGSIAIAALLEDFLYSSTETVAKTAVLVSAIVYYATRGGFTYTEVYPPHFNGVLRLFFSVGFVN